MSGSEVSNALVRTPAALAPVGDVHTFPGEGNGALAYRDKAQCPPEGADQGEFWPRRPRWAERVRFWWHEQVAAFWGDSENVAAFRETRNVWRRHPWQFVGDIWWRPWWTGGEPEVVGTYETIDPATGLHRWNVEYGKDNDFMFDTEGYYAAVLRRNL